jgi:predicted AAA+ superfamily ATPase
MYQEKLKEMNVSPPQIININFERAEFSELLDWKKLHDYIDSAVLPEKMNYVFLDEVQMVPEFQKAINSLRLKKNIDMYITGSNAYLYSQKISTLLSGRYIEIKMFPFSFREFYSAFDKIDKETAFDMYREFGGFPDIANFIMQKNADMKTLPESQMQLYFDGLYNSIIAKDISLRTGIDTVLEINRVVKFLFSNIGNETSFNNIMNSVNTNFKFSSMDKNVYVSKIQKIVDALLESFLFYQCDRQQLKGRELLRATPKYYSVDIGLRYHILGGNKTIDGGYMLENIVYVELLRRGFRVCTGKIDMKEVDFVAEKSNSTEYFQVSLDISSEETFKRELVSLESIEDNFDKTILTLGKVLQKSYKGIKIFNVIDWLLEN